MSLLEFAITVCVILLLIAAATYKAWIIMAEAERVTVLQILNNIRLGLTLSVIKQETTGNAAQLSQTTCFNPMTFIPSPPSNYLGDLKTLPAAQSVLGSWYFDSDNCQLVYQWRFTYTLQNLRIHPDSSHFVVKKIVESTPSSQRVLKLVLEATKS
jgi:hypothetical protein